MPAVTFNGKQLELAGELPVVGAQAPSFTLTANDLSERRLRDYLGNVLVLATVPSLDTPVCDLEGRRFNEEAARLGDKVTIAMVSCDTPFAQARWCGATGAKNVLTLSDYKEHDFGRHYGVLILELKLLARAVFVIDKSGLLAYSQLVPEITHAPDYAPVLEAIKKAL